jgi:hypothetical protein
MQMIVVEDTRAPVMVAEGVNRIREASLVKENQVKPHALVVLGNVATRIVRLVCTMAVHLAVALINLVQVKNSVKKVPVRAALAQDRAKIVLQELNLGVNLVKNSQNPVKL